MSEPLADELDAARRRRRARRATARLRDLLADALRHGAAELGKPRSGYDERPVEVALAADGRRLLAATPAPPRCAPTREAAGEREWLLVAAVVGALVELAEPGPPAGAEDLAAARRRAARRLPRARLPRPASSRDLEELARSPSTSTPARIDRLRARALALPARA